MTTYTVVSEAQSLFDIANEVYGEWTGVFLLMDDNASIDSITERLRAGQMLITRNEPINPRQATYLQDFGPFETIDPDADRPSGVGYWRLDEYEVQ
jgi:hypothetical protein